MAGATWGHQEKLEEVRKGVPHPEPPGGLGPADAVISDPGELTEHLRVMPRCELFTVHMHSVPELPRPPDCACGKYRHYPRCGSGHGGSATVGEGWGHGQAFHPSP